MLKPYILFLVSIISVYFIVSCTPPRAIINSGKVTPYKQVKVGGDFTGNLTTHFARSFYENIETIAKPLINKDSLNIDEQILYLNRTALAYAIDPFGAGYDFYVRYGVASGFDVGYKLASGTHVFDGQYQFMGSKGTVSEPADGMLHGSIGFEYGFKNYSLPNWKGLKLAQEILDFDLKRKDLLVPLIFSVAIGPEETYGSISCGIVYSHTFLNYGFGNSRIYDTLNSLSPEIVAAIHSKQNFSSLGTFFNFKLGYKYIYVIPAFAIYYQNYGKYNLIDGNQTGFKGFSLVPSFGLQINLTEVSGGLRKKDKASFGD